MRAARKLELELQAENRLDVADGDLGNGRIGLSSTSENDHLVRGLRLLLGDHGAADGHDQGDDAVDAFGRLVLGGLRLPAGSRATATFAAIQRVTGLPPWASLRETISFSSSRVGAAIDRKLWWNSSMVASWSTD